MRYTCISLIGLIFLAQCGTSVPAVAEGVRVIEPVTLQLKWTHAFQFAGYYAALAKGYYREAGLDVKIEEATPGIDPIRNVIEGKAHYGVGTSSLLLERKAGKPVVALAVIFQHSPYVLIARQDSASQGVHDLLGKRIMLEPQSDEILAYLKAEGIPLDRMTRVAHSYDPRDLIDGKVDAIAGYVINQPYYLDRAKFRYQIYTPRSAGIDFYGDNLFTTEQELRMHPERVKAFRAASLRGWQYAMQHQEEIVDLILAHYSQRHTRDYFLFEARQMIPLLRPELIEIGYMNPGRWQHIAETYAELGMMKKDFDLKGFLYEPNPPPPDLTWLYWGMGVSFLVISLISVVAVYIYRINAQLRREVAERKQVDADLLNAEWKFRALFEKGPIGVAYHEMIYDAGGKPVDYRFLDANQSYLDLMGLDPRGKTVKELFPGAEKETFKWIETYGNVSRSGKSIRFEQFFQLNGRWYDCVAYPYKPDHFVTAFFDITERRKAEVEKTKLEGQLLQAQRLESVGRLAGGVAHDFNNMLGVIIGHAELAIEQAGPAHPLYADLVEIHKAAERSAGLTRQLLAFARQQTIVIKVLNLNEIIEGMLRFLRQMIGEDIELIWQPALALWPVKLDPSQVDQILANLCVNARDAIGGVGKLTLKTANHTLDQIFCKDHPGVVPGDYVMLSVRDSGCGIEPELLDHIFEPFFTTKGIGEGTGLGLATVYGIVNQNKGFVIVESKLGQGTTFTIYLPRGEGIAFTEASPAVAAESSIQVETVLLVEDERALREICGRYLKALGYNTLEAESPGVALDLVARHSGPIHLLLTDVVMPGMNGRDLANKMKSLLPHLKCLFMSGYAADVLASRGVLDVGTQCLTKPFSRTELARKVREILESKA